MVVTSGSLIAVLEEEKVEPVEEVLTPEELEEQGEDATVEEEGRGTDDVLQGPWETVVDF